MKESFFLYHVPKLELPEAQNVCNNLDITPKTLTSSSKYTVLLFWPLVLLSLQDF